MQRDPDILRVPRTASWAFRPAAAVAVVAVLTAACATVPGRPRIEQVQTQPGRFIDHSVTITGEVTTAWGVPLVGFNVYRVSDGTGEITVVSTNRRVPGRGARVEVRGKVEDVAVLGGRALGLHLREQRLRYR
jgi:hypothetical protein